MPTAILNAVQTVACTELTIRSRGRVVVERFSWGHQPPGVVWVTGSNGSGKSSLLQVIAGWRKADAGTVRWARGADASLRYLNPEMAAPAALRVGEFVRFVEQVQSAQSEQLDELYPPHVPDDAAFGRLSTGEAKRLLLWALLSHGDGPLLLDEPYEHLAHDAKATLTALLRERARFRFVMVATNQEVAQEPADVLLHVNDARIEVSRGR